MANVVEINHQTITVKEYLGQRVLTLSEIDRVHGRPKETAGRNFRANRKHLIEDVDYFAVFSPEFETDEIRRIGICSPRGGYLITLSGYLMLVKSFTDDLAWKVQRELVNTYFKHTHTAVVPVSLPPEAPQTNCFDITRSEEAVRALELIISYAQAVIEVCSMVKQKASVEKERQRAYSIVLSDLASEVGWHAHEFRNINCTPSEKR